MSEATNAAAMVRRSGAVAVVGNSELVWVTGPDATAFLDGLLSQNIAAMPVGTTARSLLLSPQGKLRATLVVLRGEERVGLVADAGRGDVVVEDLIRFKIRVDVVIERAATPIWEVWGDAAAAGLADAPTDGFWTDVDGVVTFPMPFRHSDLGRVGVVGAVPDCSAVDPADLLSLRIELGEPLMGVDLTEKTIPQEGADVAGSVDFAKGCYLGQELVARIDSRGHVNRSLRGLIISGADVPAAGTEIVAAGKPVGNVSSAAWSEERSAVLAMALVRSEASTGSLVDIGGVDATVVDLPMSF